MGKTNTYTDIMTYLGEKYGGLAALATSINDVDEIEEIKKDILVFVKTKRGAEELKEDIENTLRGYKKLIRKKKTKPSKVMIKKRKYLTELTKYCAYYNELEEEIKEERYEDGCEEGESFEWNSRGWFGNEVFLDYIRDYDIMSSLCTAT
tara:strand:+ start:223 stop:672 length:450 start_codon:yes stop_codon:yes gene_type:complete